MGAHGWHHLFRAKAAGHDERFPIGASDLPLLPSGTACCLVSVSWGIDLLYTLSVEFDKNYSPFGQKCKAFARSCVYAKNRRDRRVLLIFCAAAWPAAIRREDDGDEHQRAAEIRAGRAGTDSRARDDGEWLSRLSRMGISGPWVGVLLCEILQRVAHAHENRPAWRRQTGQGRRVSPPAPTQDADGRPGLAGRNCTQLSFTPSHQAP